jgi:hypothetical protein
MAVTIFIHRLHIIAVLFENCYLCNIIADNGMCVEEPGFKLDLVGHYMCTGMCSFSGLLKTEECI